MDKILKQEVWIEWLEANGIEHQVLSTNGHIRVFPQAIEELEYTHGGVFDFWATTNKYTVLGTGVYPKSEAKIRELALAGQPEKKSLYE